MHRLPWLPILLVATTVMAISLMLMARESQVSESIRTLSEHAEEYVHPERFTLTNLQALDGMRGTGTAASIMPLSKNKETGDVEKFYLRGVIHTWRPERLVLTVGVQRVVLELPREVSLVCVPATLPDAQFGLSLPAASTYVDISRLPDSEKQSVSREEARKKFPVGSDIAVVAAASTLRQSAVVETLVGFGCEQV